MKKPFIFVAGCILALGITACDVKFGDVSGNISNILELKVPESITYDNVDTVSWNSVSNCDGYTVSVDGKEYNTTALSYTVSFAETKDFTFMIKARGKALYTSDSPWSETFTWHYEKKDNGGNQDDRKTKLAWPTNIQFNDATISWNEVPNAIGYQLKIEETQAIYETARTSYDVSAIFKESTSFNVKLRSIAPEESNYLNSEWTVATPFSYVKPIDTIQIGFNDTYKSNGLGRTIDLINSSSFKPKSGSGYIFNEANLFSRSLVEETIGDQSATYEYGTSFDSFYDKWKLDMGVKVANNQLGIDGNNFLPGTADFNVEIKGGYEKVSQQETEELYIKMHHNIVGKSVEIFGHASDYDYYASILSDNFKNAARKVVDKKTAETFVNSWGTHVIMAAYYGAAFEASYYNICHKGYSEDNWYVGVEVAVRKHLFFSDLDVGVDIDFERETRENNENHLTKFEAHAVGGESVALSNDLENFKTAYDAWAKSVNESTYTIIDFPDNSLYCIWDFLDDSYASQKAILDQYLVENCQVKLDSIKSKLSNIYNQTECSFTLDNNDNGSANIVSVNGQAPQANHKFMKSDRIKISATPNPGFKFSNWVVKEGELSSDVDLTSSTVEFYLVTDTILYPLFTLDESMKNYTFTALVKTESTTQGRAVFTVTGIPVLYNGQEYIYGNAYYQGALNGTRFNDVERFSLMLDNTTALFGGVVSWIGSQGDSDESGHAAWDLTYTHDSYVLSYLHRNPKDDFAGNEAVKITINGICVKVGAPTKDISTYPEVIKTSFSANIFTESTNQGRANFDFYGVKAVYNNQEYAYGCAYFNGKTGGTRFNDVSQISFKNSTAEILNGGTMIYRGSKNDRDESGMYTSTSFKVNSTECYYMAECGYDDFAGNENVTFSITNMCIRTSDTLSSNYRYLKLIEKDYKVTVYAEGKYEDYVTFSALGIETKYDNKTALLGYAYYYGKISGDRFNDCDRVVMKFDGSVAVQGGLMHYTGNHDDRSTQQTLASYSNGVSDTFTYCAEYCADDFPGKDATTMRIAINGICLLA